GRGGATGVRERNDEGCTAARHGGVRHRAQSGGGQQRANQRAGEESVSSHEEEGEYGVCRGGSQRPEWPDRRLPRRGGGEPEGARCLSGSLAGSSSSGTRPAGLWCWASYWAPS